MKNTTIGLGSPNANANTARLVETVLSAIDNESISI
jgi:hypothetical protein